MSMQWIVTGANGYLGGETAQGLFHMGKRVCGLAREGRSVSVLEEKGIHCDTYEKLTSVLAPGDIVVHCAGKVGSTGSLEEYLRINVDWSLALFDQAASGMASCFVYVSSVSALGYGNRPGGEALTESSAPRLVEGELYGKSKLQAELALQDRALKSSLRLVILRPGFIYGRRPFGSAQTWLRRGVVVDPNQRAPLVHVDSFINAVVGVGENPEAKGVFFNVDEEQPSLSELNALKIRYGLLRYSPWKIGTIGFWILTLCRNIVRFLQGRFETAPTSRAWADYLFRKRRLVYSTEKLRAAAGWSPAVTLREGLEGCAKWEKARNSDQ